MSTDLRAAVAALTEAVHGLQAALDAPRRGLAAVPPPEPFPAVLSTAQGARFVALGYDTFKRNRPYGPGSPKGWNRARIGLGRNRRFSREKLQKILDS